MWKDFFYFSKSERRAILVLLGAILCLWGCNLWLRHKQDLSPLSASDDAAVDSFLVHLEEKKAYRRTYPAYESPRDEVVLRPFDPNTADSSTLRSLGLPVFMVRNVLKYRAKGGIFRTPESFSRIYGMDESRYQELAPYITIGESFRRSGRDSQKVQPVFTRDTLQYVPDYPEGTVVELNSADTASLKRVPGIGSGLARMIVAYRERLGGFYAVTQLQEVPHVGEELNKWFTVDGESIRKLNVNKESLDRLRIHPYMNFYKAKAIMEYRRKRGKLTSFAQLSLFEEFTQEDLKRLEPYLSFE